MHIPRAMFSGAICLFCYSKYGVGSSNVSAENLNFPEFQLLDADAPSLLREANGYENGLASEVEVMSLICGLGDLLHRIGHWGVSRKFASILEVLIHAESN